MLETHEMGGAFMADAVSRSSNSIGVKMVNPETQVIGIVGDGAFLMTGMEILTAARHGLGVMFFVFHDGELSQIPQGQQVPYNRKNCTILGQFKLEGMA